ncbi:tyrosine-type recombinase/integrase [Ferrimonas gelatinilytica]|uniref:tyrosine-type recombinase/integrase n=1 Tax=Ferrimonas gelatinilytica TaxID=1255257 RepID=UPI0031E9ACB9
MVEEFSRCGVPEGAIEHGLSPNELAPHLVKEYEDSLAWEAFDQAVHGKQSNNYGCTLKDALRLWLTKNERTKSKDTITKTKQAVDKYLSWLHLQDIQLQDIRKRQVHDYVEYLGKQYASTSVFGFISRIRSVWKYACSLGEAEGECPFDGHETKGNKDKEQKQPFTPEQVQKIRENAVSLSHTMQLLIELGIYTGCRISELGKLTVGDLFEEDGVVAIQIRAGKTSAATRRIPIADHLIAKLQTMASGRAPVEPLLGINGKYASREFSRFKVANISTDPAQCFHSFRVMFSTSLQRGGVEEHVAAALLGHARGTTMTYGYYSKGYRMAMLKEALDKAVPFLKEYS